MRNTRDTIATVARIQDASYFGRCLISQDTGAMIGARVSRDTLDRSAASARIAQCESKR
jgi:hypothetical protein